MGQRQVFSMSTVLAEGETPVSPAGTLTAALEEYSAAVTISLAKREAGLVQRDASGAKAGNR